jgi:hypothetical protein
VTRDPDLEALLVAKFVVIAPVLDERAAAEPAGCCLPRMSVCKKRDR